MSVQSTIYSAIEQIAKEQKKKLAPLRDDLALLDSGLDSLCFAILVARLEDQLGIDPFSGADDVEFPVTIGEFVHAYTHARTAA